MASMYFSGYVNTTSLPDKIFFARYNGEAVGAWLRGAQRYYLQQFVDSGDVLEAGLHAVSEEKRSRCLAAAREWIPQTELRGV